MELAPVPGVVRVTLGWEAGTDLTIGTNLHFRYTGGPPSEADAASLAATLSAAVVTDLLPVLGNTNDMSGVRVTDLHSLSGGDATYAHTSGGGLAGGSLPVGVCALVNYKIARRYRGGKPRSYFPFGTDASLENERQWSAGFAAAVNAAIAAFWASANGATAGTTVLSTPCNVSYFTGSTAYVTSGGKTKYRPTPRPDGPVVDDITAAGLNTIISSQRKRYQR